MGDGISCRRRSRIWVMEYPAGGGAEYVGDGISYRRRSRMMDERKTLQK